MQRNRVFKTIALLILFAVWIGFIELSQYYIEMYYSALAPSQMSDESTYAKLQTHNTVNTVVTLIGRLGYIFILFLIYRVWYPKPKEKLLVQETEV